MLSTRPSRPLRRLVASVFALLALLPFASVPAHQTALAAAPCPSNKSHLVPWQAGRWYLSGVNVPWQGGGFGADFATVEEWGQHTYSPEATEQMFANLQAKGVNSVRWWVFADGRGAPEFNATSGGRVTGLDSTTLSSMASAIGLAAEYDIYIVFNLWSFDMLFADGTPATHGEHGGGHRDLIVDQTTRRSFIDKALLPMLRYAVPGSQYTIGTHPAVLGWDIINEPEWGISEAGALDQRIAQPVSLAEMQRFVAEVSGAIHRNSNQLVTVGSAAMKWNADLGLGVQANFWKDAALTPYDAEGKLDFYQIHYYGWMNGDSNWSYSPLRMSWAAAGFDKPTVVGEFSANAGGTGRSVSGLLDGLHEGCYGGAWAWSYYDVDSSGNWSDLAEPIGQFNTAHANEVSITGSAPITPNPSLVNKVYLPLLRKR